MPIFDENGLTWDGLTRDEYIAALRTNGYDDDSIAHKLATNRSSRPEPKGPAMTRTRLNLFAAAMFAFIGIGMALAGFPIWPLIIGAALFIGIATWIRHA